MTDMYAVPGETLTGIANAIRSKTGSDEQMPVSAMAASIESIEGLNPIVLTNYAVVESSEYYPVYQYTADKSKKLTVIVSISGAASNVVNSGIQIDVDGIVIDELSSVEDLYGSGLTLMSTVNVTAGQTVGIEAKCRRSSSGSITKEYVHLIIIY